MNIVKIFECSLLTNKRKKNYNNPGSTPLPCSSPFFRKIKIVFLYCIPKVPIPITSLSIRERNDAPAK